MSKKLSISIMAHPSREKWFGYLREKLGQDVPFAIDTDGRGIWENCKRAWLLFDPEAEYHVVVQDDVLVGRDFIERAEAMLTEDMMYSFYIGRPRFAGEVMEAKEKGIDHLVKSHIHHEICLCMRTEHIKEMIAWCDALKPENDRVIDGWVNAKGLKVRFPLPSLVDHRAEGSLHSFNRGGYVPKATWFIGE
ncbi:MAG: hypothetical protein WC763_04665 [Candidatus Paceibacterota bacterium]|jgi:hypothetical protein